MKGCVFVSKKAIDQKFYERLVKWGSFELYKFLEGNKEKREEEKQKFITNPSSNPKLDYPFIDEFDFSNYINELNLLYEDIRRSCLPGIVQEAYRTKIWEKLSEIGILKSIKENNVYVFNRENNRLYGDVDPCIFGQCLEELNSDIAKAIKKPKTELASNSILELQEIMPNIDIPLTDSIIFPKKDGLERFKNFVLGKFGYLLEGIEEKRKYNPVEVSEIFNNSLTKLEIIDWKSKVKNDSSKTGINTCQNTKTIEVNPERSIPVNGKKLKKLILHEICNHVLNRSQGEKSKFMILGGGLAKYFSSEEAIAVLSEKILNNKLSKFPSIHYYLAAGMAVGLDGKKRDFRSVYNWLFKYYMYLKTKTGKKEEKQCIEEAKNASWRVTLKTFRGTDCQKPGVILHMNKCTREKMIRVWNKVCKSTDFFKYLFRGKIDLENKDHLSILDEAYIEEGGVMYGETK